MALVRDREEALEPAREPEEYPVAVPHGLLEASRPQVLVVDDDPAITSLVAHAVSDAGYRVDVANNGYEALNKIMAEPPDLLLIDLMMPSLTGEDVVARWRKQREASGMRIVAMSAYLHLRQRAAQLALDGILHKPFDLDDLLATVRRCLSG